MSGDLLDDLGAFVAFLSTIGAFVALLFVGPL